MPALLLAAAPAEAQPSGPDGANDPIVITGIRIQDYRDRLAACLARGCPPNEDIDASLALAEALFLQGDYAQARRAVRAAISRNGRRAADYPEPVSDLYRAHSRISRHMGQDWDGLRSAHAVLESLRAGLPQEDHRHFTARLELSELHMMMGRIRPARRELDALARAARAAGREDVATIAELRRLWFDHIADPNGEALARLLELSRRAEPSERMRRTGARILLARIYRGQGRNDEADALIAEIGRGTSERRRLIHAPVYALHGDAGGGTDEDLGRMLGDGLGTSPVAVNYDGKWIDVGFWVLPDGRVSGLEVLRSGSRQTGWAEPLLGSIRGRLYSTAEEASYRLERYSLTASLAQGTASRMRVRSANSRVEYLDLTLPDAPPPPSAPTPAD